MAWERVKWSCGHTGAMQLIGKMTSREATKAYQAGRKCFGCWLLSVWRVKNDPRYALENRWNLALSITEGKGIRIYSAETKQNQSPASTDDELRDKKAALIEQLKSIDNELSSREIAQK